MIIRNLSSTGDWEWGNSKANYLTGDPAIALNIQTRLLCWLNDCFFDLGAGIDWLNMLGSKGQENMLALNIRRVILQSYGVTSLTSFAISLNAARQFQAQYAINTIFSQNYQNSLALNLNNAAGSS